MLVSTVQQNESAIPSVLNSFPFRSHSALSNLSSLCYTVWDKEKVVHIHNEILLSPQVSLDSAPSR